MTTYYDAQTGIDFTTTLPDSQIYDYLPYYEDFGDIMSRKYPLFTSELSYTPLTHTDYGNETCADTYRQAIAGISGISDISGQSASYYDTSSDYFASYPRSPRMTLPVTRCTYDVDRSYTNTRPHFSEVMSALPEVPSYQQNKYSIDRLSDNKPKETDIYVDKLCSIFSGGPTSGVPSRPSLISTGVYLGSTSNAENLSILKSLGITYVINCGVESISSLMDRKMKELYSSPRSTVKGWDTLPLQNNDSFSIEYWLRHSSELIEKSRRTVPGNILICSSDVSRSGAIAIGYLLKQGVRLVEAAKILKTERHVALCNTSYIRQLVVYARSLGRLEPHKEISTFTGTRTPKSRRRNDRRSMYRDYLEMISP